MTRSSQFNIAGLSNVILEVITSPKLCKYVFMMNLLTIIDSGRNNNPRNIFLWTM